MPQFLGSIDVGGEVDRYSVNLVAGRQYFIELEGAYSDAGSLSDPVLRILRGGVEVAFDDDGGEGLNSRIVITPSASGTYRLDVSAYGFDDTGTYRLRVFEDDFRGTIYGSGDAGTVQTGGWSAGRLHYAGDADVFAVTLIAGLRYTFEERGGSLEDPYLYLFSDWGQQLRSNDDYFGLDSRIQYAAGYTGTYFLQARSYEDTGVGNYQVSVSEGIAGNGADYISGTEFADAINGNGGGDTIDGGAGDDSLRGWTGQDTLIGGLGNDTLDGGADNDVLRGGAGRDTLLGGGGVDRFDYDFTAESTGASRDLILAYQFSDTIDLSDVDANAQVAGNQFFSELRGTGVGQLSFVDLANGNTLIRGNTSSSGGFELLIEVADGGTPASFWDPALHLIL